MRAWESEGDFRHAILSDPDVANYLKTEQIERAFSVHRQLANVDAIFGRVFDED
jgi:adenylosuccinate lyase